MNPKKITPKIPPNEVHKSVSKKANWYPTAKGNAKANLTELIRINIEIL